MSYTPEVESQPHTLREYLTPEGVSPFRDWLRSLRDARVRARIRVRLNRLRLGNFGDCRSVGDGVHELKISEGPGYRVYFGNLGPTVILLLYGGDKRKQAATIQTAKDYWRDYQGRAQ